jgi:peptide/nickel transport system permease protein
MDSRRQSESYWRIVYRQFWNDRIAVLGLAVVLVFFLVAAFADFLANDKPLVMKFGGEIYFPVIEDYAVRLGFNNWPKQFQNILFKEFVAEKFKAGDWAQFPPIRYSPADPNLSEALQRPSWQHWLGTDDVGRDVASRIIHGSRVSLSVGFVAVSIYVLIGLAIGALAGYYGGIIDIVASRAIEIMMTIPTFFLVITAIAFLPATSIFTIMVVIGLTNWPTVARLTRAEFMKTKALDYVVAARALGANDFRMIFLHVLPNTLAPVLVTATFGVASAILIESALSFLGIGVPPTVSSWGSILERARELLPTAWWLAAFPGLAIFLTVTSYNLVGEGLRDAADPRLKG